MTQTAAPKSPKIIDPPTSTQFNSDGFTQFFSFPISLVKLNILSAKVGFVVMLTIYGPNSCAIYVLQEYLLYNFAKKYLLYEIRAELNILIKNTSIFICDWIMLISV